MQGTVVQAEILATIEFMLIPIFLSSTHDIPHRISVLVRVFLDLSDVAAAFVHGHVQQNAPYYSKLDAERKTQRECRQDDGILRRRDLMAYVYEPFEHQIHAYHHEEASEEEIGNVRQDVYGDHLRYLHKPRVVRDERIRYEKRWRAGRRRETTEDARGGRGKTRLTTNTSDRNAIVNPMSLDRMPICSEKMVCEKM